MGIAQQGDIVRIVTSTSDSSGTILKMLFSFLLLIAPIYAFEWETNQLYYASNPEFFTLSGFRLDFFLAYLFFASILVGYFVFSLRVGFASAFGAVVILVALFHWACDPRVCYFMGVDGLEPLRQGWYFAAETFLGVVCGRWFRTKEKFSRTLSLVIGLSLTFVIGRFPVVYMFAGPQHSSNLIWAEPVLIILVSLAIGTIVTENSESLLLGVLIPIFGMSLIVLLLAGIGGAYVAVALGAIVVLWVLVGAGAVLGALFVKRTPSLINKRGIMITAIVLLMVAYTFVTSQVGLVVQGVPQQGQDPFQNAPVYVGGFMTGTLIPTKGVSATIDFGHTNSSVIQPDNFLAAGLGLQSPNCCVDGLDYGYRIDAYLFHDGREVVEANAWQTCDTNMACGARPWRNLMFHSTHEVTGLGRRLWLAMEWNNRNVAWYFAINGTGVVRFAFFNPPSQEDAYFNLGEVGVLAGNLPTSAAYFFQFGIMSKYAIERPGWEATISCPAYLFEGAWRCVSHAESIQGAASYWKVLWRWGTSYEMVGLMSNSDTPSVSFYYSVSTSQSYLRLW